MKIYKHYLTLNKWLNLKLLFLKSILIVECTNSNTDWLYRHGCASMLCVALKDSPEKLDKSKTEQRLTGLMSADRTQLVECGVRGYTYLLNYQIPNGIELNSDVIIPYCKVSESKLQSGLNYVR